jgi:hypothetical protein
MAKRWLEVLGTKAGAWNVPAGEVSALAGLISTAANRLQMVQSTDRSAVSTAQCKAAFGNLTVKMRFLKGHFFLSPTLSNADFISLDLKPRDLIPTPVPVPVNHAGVEVVKWAPHALGLRYFTATEIGDVKSDYGVRVYYGLVPSGASAAVNGKVFFSRLTAGVYELASLPITSEDLPNSFFTRRMKSILEFPSEASGFTCYLAARFENSKGQSGPWGVMIHAVVP